MWNWKQVKEQERNKKGKNETFLQFLTFTNWLKEPMMVFHLSKPGFVHKVKASCMHQIGNRSVNSSSTVLQSHAWSPSYL